PEEYEAAWEGALEAAEAAVAAEHDEVTSLGGLYVLGTERHESRRIDNQLRGRSGRQGDPGESRFYLSLQDSLMRRFNSGGVDRIMASSGMGDDALESKIVSRSIASAQSQVEAQNFEIRKNILKYDDVLNRQRTVIYEQRRQVLDGADLEEQMRFFVNDVIESYIAAETAEGFAEDWDLERLWQALGSLYPVTVTPEQIAESGSISRESLREEVISDAHHAYDDREETLTPDVMRQVERRVMLSVLDRKWREHLYEMDYLKEGIGLRAMAQRDPLVEYQREGYHMWQTLLESVKEDAVRLVYNAEVQVPKKPADEVAQAPQDAATLLAALPQQGASSDDSDDSDAASADAERAPAVSSGSPAPGSAPSGVVASTSTAGVADAEAPELAEAQPEVTITAPGMRTEPRSEQLHYSAPDEAGGLSEREVTALHGGTSELSEEEMAGAARNEPCPCGSGKKFKMCHGKAKAKQRR
ncbi:MAG: SEC-C metal-binding domain-containing protein, partial [Actinomycetia bacterium]|nr:SEC-C metal-binding domain-containing protein [Actinomycetes bacterium]